MNTKKQFLVLSLLFTLTISGKCNGNDENDDCLPPCTDPNSPSCQGSLTFTSPKNSNLKFNFYSTFNLNLKNICIKKAFIVIHGANMNGDDYFRYFNSAIDKKNLTESTLMIAPHFKTPSENPATDELFWSAQGYRKGDLDDHPEGDFLSSYDTVDEIIKKMNDENLFPNLNEITIVGHSAGGQFTERYAAATTIISKKPLRFIPSNTSSFLYLDELRPLPTELPSNPTTFIYPIERVNGKLKIKDLYNEFLTDKNCSNYYNDYKYGLSDRNFYFKQKTFSDLTNDYLKRNVIYLLGDNDTEIDEWVDTSCSANLQGKNRYDRGLKYFSYLSEKYPNHNHQKVVVKGVAHSPSQMFESPEGLSLLFPQEIRIDEK